MHKIAATTPVKIASPENAVGWVTKSDAAVTAPVNAPVVYRLCSHLLGPINDKKTMTEPVITPVLRAISQCAQVMPFKLPCTITIKHAGVASERRRKKNNYFFF